MPRYETNNPTARMGRVLDDFNALDAAYDEAMAIIAARDQELFESLHPKPIATAVIEERVRRQLTGEQVRWKRDYMRLRRAGGGPHVGTTRGQLRAIPVRPLTSEEEAAIMAEVEREFTKGIDSA